MLKRKNRSSPIPVLEPRFTDWASRRSPVPSGFVNTCGLTTVSGASDWAVISRSDCVL